MRKRASQRDGHIDFHTVLELCEIFIQSHALRPQRPYGQCGVGYLLDKLQALDYDILPTTTAVFSYAIGSRKLSVS